MDRAGDKDQPGPAIGSGGGRRAEGGLESLLTVSGARRARRARPAGRPIPKGAAEQGVGRGDTRGGGGR